MYITTRYRASSIIYDLVLASRGNWLIPDNVCHSVYAAIVAAGGEPIIIDVVESTLEIDQYKALNFMKKNKVSGIILVRTFGNVGSDFTDFIVNAKEINESIVVVDDLCLAPPEINYPKGNADVFLYSTGYSKVVDLGYGGFSFSKMDILNSKRLYKGNEENIFNNFFKLLIEGEGVEMKPEVIKISKLEWINGQSVSSNDYFKEILSGLKASLMHKEELNRMYRNDIKPEFQLGDRFNIWRFNVILLNRDEILQRLFDNHLFGSKHYYPLSKLLNGEERGIWNDTYKYMVNLFNDFRFDTIMAANTIEIINKYGRSSR